MTPSAVWKAFFYDSRHSRWLNRINRRLSKLLPRRKPPPGIKIYFGWQSWTLTPLEIDLILKFCHDRPDVLSWCKFVKLSDESFFQTALANSGGLIGTDRNVRRFIRFNNGNAHPTILSPADIDEVCSGRFWFARKLYKSEPPGIREEIDRRNSRKRLSWAAPIENPLY